MAKPERCNCMAVVDRELADRGVQIKSGFTIDFDTGEAALVGPYVTVEKLPDAKRMLKLPLVICSYCPFCGEKLVH